MTPFVSKPTHTHARTDINNDKTGPDANSHTLCNHCCPNLPMITPCVVMGRQEPTGMTSDSVTKRLMHRVLGAPRRFRLEADDDDKEAEELLLLVSSGSVLPPSGAAVAALCSPAWSTASLAAMRDEWYRYCPANKEKEKGEKEKEKDKDKEKEKANKGNSLNVT